SRGHSRSQISCCDRRDAGAGTWQNRSARLSSLVIILSSRARDLLFNKEKRMKTLQRTFAIIKPDAVAKNATGDIISTISSQGFRIIGMKQLHITKSQAEGF